MGEAVQVIDGDNLGQNNPLIQIVKQKVAEAVTKVVGQEINEMLLNYSASTILGYLYTGKPIPN